MKNVEAILLAIPGVTEARVTINVQMRCESPFDMNDGALHIVQTVADEIECETGWEVDWRYQTHPLPATAKEGP